MSCYRCAALRVWSMLKILTFYMMGCWKIPENPISKEAEITDSFKFGLFCNWKLFMEIPSSWELHKNLPYIGPLPAL